MIRPVGKRVLISTAVHFGWPLDNLDVKYAFRQTGSAPRDVYAIPPSESADRGNVLRLLEKASYRMFNANSKCEAMRDDLPLAIGFKIAPLMTQLIIMKKQDHKIALAAKLLD